MQSVYPLNKMLEGSRICGFRPIFPAAEMWDRFESFSNPKMQLENLKMRAMLKIGMHKWRSHPILTAAGIGAVLGAANSVYLEIGGLRNRTMTGVLPLLFPSSVHDLHVGQMTVLQVALLLLIEVAGNVLGFALVFAVPAALVVGIRGLFGGRRNEDSRRARDS